MERNCSWCGGSVGAGKQLFGVGGILVCLPALALPTEPRQEELGCGAPRSVLESWPSTGAKGRSAGWEVGALPQARVLWRLAASAERRQPCHYCYYLFSERGILAA